VARRFTFNARQDHENSGEREREIVLVIDLLTKKFSILIILCFADSIIYTVIKKTL